MDGQREAVLAVAVSITAIIFPVRNQALACGPFFPDTVLSLDDQTLIGMPAGSFVHELSLLRREALATRPADGPRYPSASDIDTFAVETGDADVADLQRYLRANPSIPDPEKLLAQLTRFRAAVKQHARELARHIDRPWDTTARPKFAPPDPILLAELPAEFELYGRGALAWHQDEREQAREFFQRVLQLPVERRRYRSVWAAYMIGRSYVETDVQRCSQHLRMARQLAAEGFHDSTGLARASLGWEARAHYLQKQYAPAIALYMQQLDAGDARAAVSLRDVALAALKLPTDELSVLVRDPLAQQVLTAAAVSIETVRHEEAPVEGAAVAARTRPLLEAIERSGKVVAGADRMAWLAYQIGDYAGASRWAKSAPPGSALGLLIQAKLALRQGDSALAGELLANAIRRFPPEEQWDRSIRVAEELPYVPEEYSPRDHAMGELAVLRLQRRHYVEALDLLMDSGWYVDAAYLGERVLTVEELKHFVEQRYPRSTRPESNEDLRYLLARRLIRLGRWKEARDYLPADWVPTLDAYISFIRTGHDKTRTKAERASALWNAAQIARKHGMELMGTELGPDAAVFGGGFELTSGGDRRQLGQANRLNVPSKDELVRAEQSRPEPDKRFHYRYVAADHAWAAAELMEDNSEQLALVLHTAGLWLAPQDPQAADRFYKALVRRCPKTKLGRESDALRWFAR